MGGFFAGCLALLALALGFALYPWWAPPRPRADSMRELLARAHGLRKDEMQQDVEVGWLSPELFGEAEMELDRGLLEDVRELEEPALRPVRERWVAAALALGVIALGGGLMLASSEVARFAIFGEDADDSAQVETRHERLRAQVEQNPRAVESWAQLGDFYRSQGRAQEAVDAWRHANALLDYADPSALAALADATAMAAGDWFSDEAVDYLERALNLDPRHQKALWLAGWAAWQREDAEGAARYWTRLLEVLPPAEEGVRAMVENFLAEARAQAGAPAVGPSLQVEVALDPALAAAYAADATLFVYARRLAGPPMPLAIWRGPVGELPMRTVLDDSRAMIPEMKLSQAGEVVVVARISASGEAARQSGDLIGETGPVTVAPHVDVRVTIDRRVP